MPEGSNKKAFRVCSLFLKLLFRFFFATAPPQTSDSIFRQNFLTVNFQNFYTDVCRWRLKSETKLTDCRRVVLITPSHPRKRRKKNGKSYTIKLCKSTETDSQITKNPSKTATRKFKIIHATAKTKMQILTSVSTLGVVILTLHIYFRFDKLPFSIVWKL